MTLGTLDSKESVSGINFVFLLKKDRNEWVEWTSGSEGILDNHPCLKWRFVVEVRVWVSGVCEDLGFKRETFYSAIGLLDR